MMITRPCISCGKQFTQSSIYDNQLQCKPYCYSINKANYRATHQLVRNYQSTYPKNRVDKIRITPQSSEQSSKRPSRKPIITIEDIHKSKLTNNQTTRGFLLFLQQYSSTLPLELLRIIYSYIHEPSIINDIQKHDYYIISKDCTYRNSTIATIGTIIIISPSVSFWYHQNIVMSYLTTSPLYRYLDINDKLRYFYPINETQWYMELCML